MKRLLVLLVALLLVACSSAPTTYTEGTYTGTGNGYGGEITVEVIVDAEGNLTGIDVTDHSESIGEIPAVETALTEIPQEIIKNNGTDGVDVTSGATRTSEGIKEAVDNALEQAQ